jgi:ABC-type Na+ efflux pump permease subunit
MYLFTINTIFIAMATFIVLKILRFPMLKYVNSKRRTFISRMATLLAIIVIIPAIWTFISVLKQSRFEIDAKNFINTELETLPNSSYIKKYATYSYNPEGQSIIELIPFGTDEIPQTTKDLLEQRFGNYNALYNTKLYINQVKNRTVNNLEYMEELRTRDSLDLLTQTQKVSILENKVKELSKLEKNHIDLNALLDEMKISYDKIDQFTYASVINSNFKKMDTLRVFSVKWVDSLTNEKFRDQDKERLEKWLKYKLKLDTLVVKRLN